MTVSKQELCKPQNRVALRGMALAGVLFVALAAIGTSLAMGRAMPVPVPATAVAPKAAIAAPAPVEAVASIGITVCDLDRSVGFYTSILGFEKIAENEQAGDAIEHLTGVFGARVRTAILHLGNERIELTQYLAPEGRPIPPDSRSNDRSFQHIAIVTSDMERAYAQLRAHRVRHASTGPQTLPKTIPGAAGISAFYFKDPDGHALEIIHFPEGKGDPRWQQPPSPCDRLFLGIDHTAIVVADTDASLRFYRDTLGLRVAGTSENFGVEQEHLNNVFGARLRITALRAAKGPGVELLEYLSPGTGRAYPADSHASDLWHWQTAFTTTALDSCAVRLREAHTQWVSPGIVADAREANALMVRDPDGHAVMVTSKPSN